MLLPTRQSFQHAGISNADFSKLSGFIYANYGIKLPISKKVMLEGRLQKRLKALELTSFKAYCDYVFSTEGQRLELAQMIDVITTNKTDFFRESAHFDFLLNRYLPIVYNQQTSAIKLLNFWSAGCSTGEEPYTLAMALSEFAEGHPGFDFDIFATDISTRALSAATTAVYAEEKVIPVPLALKRKYLLKSKDTQKRTVRIVPELRSRVKFERLNFINDDFAALPTFNIIFCRNVLIYFDRITQEKVINKLCLKIEKGGLLFLGHSESISHMNVPLEQIHPTIFKKL